MSGGRRPFTDHDNRKSRHLHINAGPNKENEFGQLRSGLFKAFVEALTVYTKEVMPDRWLDVMSQHGIILLALGEPVTGNVTLEMG